MDLILVPAISYVGQSIVYVPPGIGRIHINPREGMGSQAAF